MILRLHIENFALIDNIDLEFSNGLNVLTGETGAGKSIIIDAMGVITGKAGSQEYIRSGEAKALVEALFDISGYADLSSKLEGLGLDAEEDNSLLLSREINRSGRNLCRINGRPVTLSMYREIGELLVDIYGQHHQQSLLKKEKHLILLDSFGGNDLNKGLDTLRETVSLYNTLLKELQEIQRDESDKARRLDMFNFQLKEIDDANLDPLEEDKMLDERTILSNAENLMDLTRNVYRDLYEGASQKQSAVDLLHNALHNLKELAEIDNSLLSLAIQLEESLYNVEDCAREIGIYKDNIIYDPERLNYLETRLEKIKKLKLKYGTTISEILGYRDEIAAAVEKIQSSEEELERLNAKLKEVEEKYKAYAEKLSSKRKKVGKKIEKEICHELKDLNMPHVEFSIDFKIREKVNKEGIDDIEFLIAPNMGEPLKPLSKIASGGEMSRIMLALKTILAKVDEIPTLIFDEIDAGLGGITVQSVAQKLALIGRTRQVICVTHSPQITGFADNHFKILKETKKKRTVTKVVPLDRQHRIEEVARMLGGQNITSITKENAIEMIKYADDYKKNI